MKSLIPTLACLLVKAEISPDSVCQSACGLVASLDQCKLSSARRDTCLHLQKDLSGNLVYELGKVAGHEPISVKEAEALVIAEDNNCFAMYYEQDDIKRFASYCAENNVCPHLYWDKMGEQQARRSFQFFDGFIEGANVASPIMCDYNIAEKPHIEEEHLNEVDPCKALCYLGGFGAACEHVQREDSYCIRLFWVDASRTSTEFSVRKPSGSQIQVTVSEARDLLIPEKETCDSLCKADEKCKLTESHCSENKTCKGLFFLPGPPIRTEMKVCFGADCQTDSTPVFCGYDEISINPAQPTSFSAIEDTKNATALAETSNPNSGGVFSATGFICVFLAAIVAIM